ncbi:PREDICTED: uncharacterized protein LOC106898581, partial [Calidris pugnax]|uniref:uncharacterized protein LOC106898581 n=1 Tax=Calidris pugnax TaxID=198806 RepID=UPI00071C8635
VHGGTLGVAGGGSVTAVPSPATGDLCPTEENLYEPLDPAIAVPDPPGTPWGRVGANQAPLKTSAPQFSPEGGSGVTHPALPVWGSSSRKKVLLVGMVALGVSLLVNVLLLALGSRHVAALTAALEAERSKELPDMASQSFQLYNEAHDMCVETRGQDLTVTTCQPQEVAQRFQWLPGGRLRGWGAQRCVTATSSQNLALVRLERCREDTGLQRWECGAGGLLALAGFKLYFNYGNNRLKTVMLYSGDREWSRWVIPGSKETLCSRSVCSPCPKGWSYFGNSCYFYSKTASSWENARHFCSALGTELLEVEGAKERTPKCPP